MAGEALSRGWPGVALGHLVGQPPKLAFTDFLSLLIHDEVDLGVVWLICFKRTQRLLFLVSNMAMAVLPLAIAARCSIQWLPISFDVLAWVLLMITLWWIAAERPPWLNMTKLNVPIRVEPYLMPSDEVSVKPKPLHPGHPVMVVSR